MPRGPTASSARTWASRAAVARRRHSAPVRVAVSAAAAWSLLSAVSSRSSRSTPRRAVSSRRSSHIRPARPGGTATPAIAHAVPACRSSRAAGSMPELRAGQPQQHPPRPVEGVLDRAFLVRALVHEPLLEPGPEVQVELVGRAQRAAADDLGELAHLPGSGQRGEQLGGDVEVVVAGAARPGAAAASAGTATPAGRRAGRCRGRAPRATARSDPR